jgi:predicted Zn-dependent protease
MLLIHENLLEEAVMLAETIKSVYGMECVLENRIFDEFEKIPNFDNGYRPWSDKTIKEIIHELCMKKYPEQRGVFLLTRKDIYGASNSQNNDWSFGQSLGTSPYHCVSTARIKRLNSSAPSDELLVSKELYHHRLRFLTIHEIGHCQVAGSHFKEAIWFNNKDRNEQPLGSHCPNNACVMYEFVDILTPDKDEGYLIFGDEPRYDAGMNETIARCPPDWFCSKCLAELERKLERISSRNP